MAQPIETSGQHAAAPARPAAGLPYALWTIANAEMPTTVGLTRSEFDFVVLAALDFFDKPATVEVCAEEGFDLDSLKAKLMPMAKAAAQ